METLQLKDFLKYQFLSGLKYSPDGTKAAFVVSVANEEENCYEGRLWLYADGTLRQLTDLGGERSFIWEDNENILFPSVRTNEERKRQKAKEGFTSYYRLNVHGGEAVHAFTVPVSASGIRKTENGYIVLGNIDSNYPDYYKMTKEERADLAKFYDEEKDYEVIDERPFWFNAQGMINKRRTALFTCTAEGKLERITAPCFNTDFVAVMDDCVVFTGEDFSIHKAYTPANFYRLNPQTGEVAPILERPDWKLSNVERVGNEIWFGATDEKRYGMSENPCVYAMSAKGGEPRLLRREEYDMHNSVGSDCRYGSGAGWQGKGGALYHLTTREGDGVMYRLTADGESTPVITKSGSLDSFTLNENAEKALLIGLYDNQLQELYEADLATGEVKQISHFNTKVLEGKYISDYYPVSVESEGLTIGGWVLLPKDFDPAKKYPAVLDVHGGPKTAYGPVFYHEMQLWANMGYFVFFCNPQGSDGRDNQFMDMRGRYGTTDFKNLMDFTDAVLAAYPQIDPERVCETGGSYGGFMTNWIIGHTDRFCCAASQRSISNWLSFYGVADIGHFFPQDQIAGNPFDDTAKLWDRSPVSHARNVKTPTLFIHADEDFRCPLEQGIQMYSALVDHGIPARMCVFHGENHELSRSGKPRHRVRRLTEITNWFEKYAKKA